MPEAVDPKDDDGGKEEGHGAQGGGAEVGDEWDGGEDDALPIGSLVAVDTQIAAHSHNEEVQQQEA